ncbi:MAG: hypothetical protein ABIA12_01990 [Candidatus Aenigmatarchaeota archaeon]
MPNNESVAEREMREMKSMEMMIDRSEMRRLTEFVDATNRISGIVLRKAEMDDNFSGVYSKAIERMVELQMLGGEDAVLNDEAFLRVFGDSGG